VADRTQPTESYQPDQLDDLDLESLALDAMDQAEKFRKGGSHVDRPASVLHFGLAGVTYALLAVAREVRALREEPWQERKQTRRRSS
jgi:hypothetical protein